MSRNVNVVILCEDRQHEVFVRRFLKRMGYGLRELKVKINPRGRGAGEQYVRKEFTEQLGYYRARQHRVRQALVVVIDADRQSVADRINQLNHACQRSGVSPRRPGERVAIFVPARNIETWLAYLDGKSVNENDKYPRLERQRDCQRHVDHLYEMCQQCALRQPSPPSLDAACTEYRSRMPL